MSGASGPPAEPLWQSSMRAKPSFVADENPVAKPDTANSKANIRKLFDLFDDDHSGVINSNNIRRVAKELGETMNVQELEEMLQRAASNGREISRDDFYNIMTKKAF